MNVDDKLSHIRAFRIFHGRGGPVAAANESKCCFFEAVGDARNFLHLNYTGLPEAFEDCLLFKLGLFGERSIIGASTQEEVNIGSKGQRLSVSVIHTNLLCLRVNN